MVAVVGLGQRPRYVASRSGHDEARRLRAPGGGGFVGLAAPEVLASKLSSASDCFGLRRGMRPPTGHDTLAAGSGAATLPHPGAGVPGREPVASSPQPFNPEGAPFG